MRPPFIHILLIAGLAVSAFAEEVILPERLLLEQTEEPPFKYNGILSTSNATGSASIVQDGVFITAGHVVFDEESLSWVPASQLEFFPRYHRPSLSAPIGSSYSPVASVRFESYKTRVENDDSGSGLSSLDTFNLDFAAGYFSPLNNFHMLIQYPEVHIDAPESVSILREDREKMIVGYPSDSDFVPTTDRGLMHRTEPGNYFCFWNGFHSIPNSWWDTEDFWVATYQFENVATYSGNSGGPIYALDDNGEWAVSGVVVGGIGSEGVLVRAIDEAAWERIEFAVSERNKPGLRRPGQPAITAIQGNAARLDWEDTSRNEAGFTIFRQDDGTWDPVAVLPADATTWTDTTVESGHVYRYEIQAFGASGLRSPRSPEALIKTAGSDKALAGFIGQPWLKLSNSGASNWFLDSENRLRSGVIGAMSHSTLQLDVIGPGTLRFDWRVSSEVNPDYGSGGLEGSEIYDAVYFHLNGVLYNGQGEDLFLSGITGTDSVEIPVDTGPMRIEWRYEKDPYTSEGEDAAFIDSIEWIPADESPYPILGGYSIEGSNLHESTWFGTYEYTGQGWIGHYELGWLFLRDASGYGLHLYSPEEELGNLYTHPELFPYFYSFDRQDWLFYYEDSGDGGNHAYFYDFKASAPLEVN